MWRDDRVRCNQANVAVRPKQPGHAKKEAGDKVRIATRPVGHPASEEGAVIETLCGADLRSALKRRIAHDRIEPAPLPQHGQLERPVKRVAVGPVDLGHLAHRAPHLGEPVLGERRRLGPCGVACDGGCVRVEHHPHGSTLETCPIYTSTDCFETFVQPDLTPTIGDLGGELHAHRSALMLDRQEGLTKTYNRVHDADECADDIVSLREIHVALDYAVRDAYGWDDLDLGHDFHETKLGTRYTFAPQPRQEVLDWLLELNHERYAEEVRQGLHAKRKGKPKRAPTAGGTMTVGFDDG